MGIHSMDTMVGPIYSLLVIATGFIVLTRVKELWISRERKWSSLGAEMGVWIPRKGEW
jgi:hypothetical protein